MKSVLISIQPYWVFLIIAKIMGWNIGKEKTVEVRKNYPKAENWNKVVKIYCSKDKRSFSKIPKEYQPLMERFLGKVIGEFVCDYIFEIKEEYEIHTELPGNPVEAWYSWEDAPEEYEMEADIEKATCLTFREIQEYMGVDSGCYCWHIPNMVLYDQPKDLEKVYRVHNVKMYDLAGNYKHNMDVRQGITRAPQSWYYVDGVG